MRTQSTIFCVMWLYSVSVVYMILWAIEPRKFVILMRQMWYAKLEAEYLFICQCCCGCQFKSRSSSMLSILYLRNTGVRAIHFSSSSLIFFSFNVFAFFSVSFRLPLRIFIVRSVHTCLWVDNGNFWCALICVLCAMSILYVFNSCFRYTNENQFEQKKIEK